MSDLAITARCWDDLAELDPEVAEHILVVFAERRALDPQSGETMRRIGGPVRKLHADLPTASLRAVTWYDRSRDVCWLLAAGEHDGVYERVERLADEGRLMPSPQDNANFEADAPQRLIKRVIRQARPTLAAALGQPGTEFALTEAPLPRVSLRVDDEQLWVRIVIVERGRRSVTERQVAAIWLAVFGTANLTFSSPADGGSWDSLYLVGPIPDPDGWPPIERFIFG